MIGADVSAPSSINLLMDMAYTWYAPAAPNLVLTMIQVYCTVSSEAKIQYLSEHYGIDRSHIFNSRNSSFLLAIMDATGGRGVDVVLNSLSGELLQASWQCVAPFGVMIEIGKRDFRRRTRLPMEDFEDNRTFIGFDLWPFSKIRPHQAAG